MLCTREHKSSVKFLNYYIVCIGLPTSPTPLFRQPSPPFCLLQISISETLILAVGHRNKGFFSYVTESRSAIAYLRKLLFLVCSFIRFVDHVLLNKMVDEVIQLVVEKLRRSNQTLNIHFLVTQRFVLVMHGILSVKVSSPQK